MKVFLFFFIFHGFLKICFCFELYTQKERERDILFFIFYFFLTIIQCMFFIYLCCVITTLTLKWPMQLAGGKMTKMSLFFEAVER
jgi:glycopeptide antibiotics resistance protein